MEVLVGIACIAATDLWIVVQIVSLPIAREQARHAFAVDIQARFAAIASEVQTAGQTETLEVNFGCHVSQSRSDSVELTSPHRLFEVAVAQTACPVDR